MRRAHNRPSDKVRALKVSYGVFPYAAGSTLFQIGSTKILSAVTLQSGVPPFLRGKKSGWLTAEYALLPASTPVRTIRDVVSSKRPGRTIEISRLIGRALRAVCAFDMIGENTIHVDCDVLQADGGTRTASICGAYLALAAAQRRWLSEGIISQPFLHDELAAVSVGLSSEGALLDLDYSEDSVTHADFNFVITRSEKIVEIQGAAEKHPFSFDQYAEMQQLSVLGVQELFAFYDENRCHEAVMGGAHKSYEHVSEEQY